MYYSAVKCLGRCVALLALAILVAISAVGAQEPAADDISKPLAQWQSTLDRVEKAIEREANDDKALLELRGETDAVAAAALKYSEELKPRLAQTESQLTRLGPPPKEDAAPESDALQGERKALNTEKANVEGAIKRAGVIAVRAEQLTARILNQRVLNFASRLQERQTSPLLPAFWQAVANEGARGLWQIRKLGEDMWTAATKPEIIVLIGFALILFIGLNRPAAQAIRARQATGLDEAPRFFARSIAAITLAIMLAAPWVVSTIVILFALDVMEQIPQRLYPLARAVLYAVGVFAVTRALAIALLSPRAPQWRMLPVPVRRSNRMVAVISAIAGVYAFDIFFNGLSQALYLALPLTLAESVIAALIFSALLIRLLLYRIVPARPGETKAAARLRPFWLKLPLWLVALALIALTFAGYIALTRFLLAQVVITTSIIVAVIVVHLAIAAFTEEIAKQESPSGQWISKVTGSDPGRMGFIGFLLQSILNLTLLLVTIPLLLTQWGLAWTDVGSGAQKLLFGLRIGNINISLITLLSALAIFIVGFVITRFAQNWVERGIRSTGNADVGLVNSLRTVIGYAGIALAALLAVSHTGFNLTSVAIVAGALSVGIGFGLQSIVNNFISGLIVLAERPIKVGDWVVIGDTEGHVRRISVRATEIETFDRASVIVPNSEFITGKLVNWTHKSALGRVTIPVGVAYDSDPDIVTEILLEAAKAHPKSLQWPGPFVVFEDFGASSLDFSVRVYVANINDALSIRTELRMTILKAFRQAGIEIPYPQRDVHVRSMTLPAKNQGKPNEQPEARPAEPIDPTS